MKTHGKPQNRFPTVSHSSLEIPLGFLPLPQPDERVPNFLVSPCVSLGVQFSENESTWHLGSSFALQIWSQHSSVLGGFLKTPPIPWLDGLVLFGLGAVPLLVLETIKALRPTQYSNLRTSGTGSE